MLCGAAAVLLKFSLCLQRFQNMAARIFASSAYDVTVKPICENGRGVESHTAIDFYTD